MSFFITTFLFSIIGFSYVKLLSILAIHNDQYKLHIRDLVSQATSFFQVFYDIKIFFQVCYEIATNLQNIANHISTVIGTWLLITDADFLESLNKIEYEEKYNDVFDKFMDSYPSSSTKEHNITTSSILFEYTPIGNVIMYYDEKEKCLFYYASRSLTTRQLQSIGRKFVIQFCCPQIIEEMRLEKEEKPKTSENSDDKPKHGLASKSGVMAKFKSNVKEDKTDTNKEPTDKSTPEPETVDNVKFLKFLRKGSLADFSFTQKIKIPKRQTQITNTPDTTITPMTTEQVHVIETIDTSKVSFSEYKKLMKMKQENSDDNKETNTPSLIST